MLGESDEFRHLHGAVEKAAGDRERAIRNVCRLYGVNRLDALPPASGQPRWPCSRTSETPPELDETRFRQLDVSGRRPVRDPCEVP